MRKFLKIPALFVLFVGLSGFWFGNNTPQPTPPVPTYEGPCDLITCVEAWSVTRAMTVTYTGPLFQLYNTNTMATQQVGINPSTHQADMSTWSAFCGGATSNCFISQIYSQINTSTAGIANNLVPSTRTGNPSQPNCTLSNTVCATQFSIETATTGLPIIQTTSNNPQPEYYIGSPGSDDRSMININTSTTASFSLVYVGQSVLTPATNMCCGQFGMTHKWSAGTTSGTDFMAYFAFGNSVFNHCIAAGVYCAGIEEETISDVATYNTPGKNVVLAITFNPADDAGNQRITGTLNYISILTNYIPVGFYPNQQPLQASSPIILEGYFHLGGGGDLSQPDPVLMRESFVYNVELNAIQIRQLTDNVVNFYSPLGLTFPP